jgi:hypothetical protein
MNKPAVLLLLLMLLLSACGGAAAPTPTPIPASVARPDQPTPAYPNEADVFTLVTPVATAQFAPTPAADSGVTVDTTANAGRAAIKLFIQNQTPSAVGIAAGGASIYAAPGGGLVAGIPVGGVVTVTGKSADGQWYSAYDNDFAFGWVPAGQLRVYGGDDLVVVDQALDPAPVATLLAQSAQPVKVLDDLLATLQASPVTVEQASATPEPATVENTPAPAATPTLVATAAPTAEPDALIALATPTLTATTAPTAAPDGLVALATPTPASAAAANAEQAGPSEPGAAVLETAGVQTGIVASDGRLNLRTAPEPNAAIVLKLDPGTQVTVLDRSPGGDWLRIQLADGSAGWVAAEFIR